MLKLFITHKIKRPRQRTNLLGSCLKHIYPEEQILFFRVHVQIPLVIPQRPLGVRIPNEKQKPPLLAELGA